MREGELYSALAHALDIPFEGRLDFPAFVRGRRSPLVRHTERQVPWGGSMGPPRAMAR